MSKFLDDPLTDGLLDSGIIDFPIRKATLLEGHGHELVERALPSALHGLGEESDERITISREGFRVLLRPAS